VCDLYDPVEHRTLNLILGIDPGVASYGYLGLTQWFLGYGDRALKNVEKASSVADQLQNAFTEMIADFYRSEFHYLRLEAPAAKEAAQRAIEICSKYEFSYFLLQSQMVRNWAIAVGDWAIAFRGREQERMTSNLIDLAQGYLAGGPELAYPTMLNVLAQVCLLVGSKQEALVYLDEALHYQEKNGERRVQADTFRLQG
ncbi:MAG: hypothetical protein ACK2U5_15765, partial [Candidatus Promineifilaceae bacterium]